jgi:hypothetical protein
MCLITKGRKLGSLRGFAVHFCQCVNLHSVTIDDGQYKAVFCALR